MPRPDVFHATLVDGMLDGSKLDMSQFPFAPKMPPTTLAVVLDRFAYRHALVAPWTYRAESHPCGVIDLNGPPWFETWFDDYARRHCLVGEPRALVKAACRAAWFASVARWIDARLPTPRRNPMTVLLTVPQSHRPVTARRPEPRPYRQVWIVAGDRDAGTEPSCYVAKLLDATKDAVVVEVDGLAMRMPRRWGSYRVLMSETRALRTFRRMMKAWTDWLIEAAREAAAKGVEPADSNSVFVAIASIQHQAVACPA